MDTNYYLRKLYQDMQLRAYSEHTQEVSGRAMRKFLNFSRKSVEMLEEQDVRKYTWEIPLLRGLHFPVRLQAITQSFKRV